MPAAAAMDAGSSISAAAVPNPAVGPVPKIAIVARLRVGSVDGARVAVERLVGHLESTSAFGTSRPVGASTTSDAVVRLYIGFAPLATTDEQAVEALQEELAGRFKGLDVYLETFRPSAGVGTLADVWKALGGKAFADGADHVVLWRTAQAAFSEPDWTRYLLDESAGLARTLAASLGQADLAPALAGFGCVALLSQDRLRDGFDLMLPRAHYESLAGHVLPQAWVVDAALGGPSVDRRLYYTYAKLNAARPSMRCGLLHGTLGKDEIKMTPPPPARLQISDEDETVRVLASHLVARMGLDNSNKETRNGGSGAGTSALALLRRRGLPPSLDVVVPTYRVDMELLQGICGNPPVNQGTLNYVVVDDPNKLTLDNFRRGGGDVPTPLLTVAIMQRRLSQQAKPTLVLVNPVNVGVTRSRNRGIQASGAEWIVLQDDDVVPDPGLLQAYSEAIARDAAQEIAATEEAAAGKPVVGFCGMIHFPEPYNYFTGAVRMSGVTNAFEIAQLTPEPVWGCTANVCMRNGPWLHFDEDWEKCGGGEDIDFFLRLQDVGRVRSAYAAAVTHPWWTNGRRSYWHFRMWGLGDGRLQKLYPGTCYRSAPNAVETLAVVLPVLLSVWLAAYMGLLGGRWTTPTWVVGLASMIGLGVLEVDMLGNVLCDRFLLRVVNSESLGTWRRTLGAMETALILGACELGRLQYHLCHRNGRLRDLGVRFDFYAGKIPRARRAWKITYAIKFGGLVLYGIGLQVWLVTMGMHGRVGVGVVLLWVGTALLHAGCLAFLASLVCMA